MAEPKPEQIQAFMNSIEAQGIIVMTFDQLKFHVTSMARSGGLQQELSIIADALGKQVWEMLEGQRQRAIQQKFKFDPSLDPNYRSER